MRNLLIILFIGINLIVNAQILKVTQLTPEWTEKMDKNGMEGYCFSSNDGISWKYFYPNGNIWREASFDSQGKMNGKFNTYWENGLINITTSYNHGIENDFRFQYYENGQFEGKDYESKRAPFNIKYYENGQLRQVYLNCNFSQGDKPNKNNCQVGYYFSDFGEKDIDNHHSQSFIEGLNMKKWPGGKTCFEGKIINGLQQGKWTFYYEDGTKSSETYFKNGIQDSIFESWFPNGKLNTRIRIDNKSNFQISGRIYGFKETFYINGKPKYKEEGLTKTYYTPNGELIKKEEFEQYEFMDEGVKVKGLKLKNFD